MKTAKQNVLEILQTLPDESSYEDIMEKIYFLKKVEAGLKDLQEGRSIPHEEVKKRLAKWLK